MNNDSKFEKIEMAMAHHEQQIHDLSEMINEQWQQIEMLKRQLDRAHDKLSAIESGATESAQDAGLSVSEIAARDKPPHY